MVWSKIRRVWEEVWWFIADDDSLASWIVNILLAFILIKFLVYPGLGLVLSTSHPVVAVVSGSMEHRISYDPLNRQVICGKVVEGTNPIPFDNYWDICGGWYEQNANITKEQFRDFRYHNGFNTGDIMVLRGADATNIKVGDTIVFQTGRPEPIIHRVIKKFEEDGTYYFQTKGDNNKGSNPDEKRITEDRIIGKALIRLRFLGWVKITFVRFIETIGIMEVL